MYVYVEGEYERETVYEIKLEMSVKDADKIALRKAVDSAEERRDAFIDQGCVPLRNPFPRASPTYLRCRSD